MWLKIAAGMGHDTLLALYEAPECDFRAILRPTPYPGKAGIEPTRDPITTPRIKPKVAFGNSRNSHLMMSGILRPVRMTNSPAQITVLAMLLKIALASAEMFKRPVQRLISLFEASNLPKKESILA